MLENKAEKRYWYSGGGFNCQQTLGFPKQNRFARVVKPVLFSEALVVYSMKHLKRNIIIGLLLWVLALGCSVQGMPKLVTGALSNDTPFAIIPFNDADVVSLNIFVRSGGLYETEATEGLSHYYEHMFFRGTPTFSGLDFKRRIENMGGSLNATTSHDMVHFQIDVPKHFYSEALGLLADATWNAEVSDEAVQKEGPVILEELRLYENNPQRKKFAKLYSYLYPNYPYGREVIGMRDMLERYSRQDLLKVKERFYQPQNIALVVAGAVDISQVKGRLEKLFGNRSATGKREQPPAYQPAVRGLGEQIKELRYRTPSSEYLVAFPGPGIHQIRDVAALDLWMFVSNGQGKHSLSSSDIVDKRGVRASVNYLTQVVSGPIIVAFRGHRTRMNTMKNELDKWLSSWSHNTLTKEELDIARRQVITLQKSTNSSPTKIASQLGMYLLYDEPQGLLDYENALESLSAEEVMAVVRKYFSQDRVTFFVKGQ